MSSARPHEIDPDRRRLPSLDGVRGIAVLAVVASHYASFLKGGGLPFVINGVANYGGFGVDLFFALSGFLITGILLATRGHQNYFLSFYARRVLRIFPIYYLTLAFMFWVETVLPAAGAINPAPQNRPLFYLFLDNWVGLWRGGWSLNSLSHFWSLAVEEQFYLIWPLVVLLFGDRRLKRIALFLAAVALILRSAYLFHVGINQVPMLATITRCDGLVFGAFAAAIYFEGTEIPLPTLIRCMTIPLLGFFAIVEVFGPYSAPYLSFGFTLAGISFAALLLYLAQTDGGSNRLQRFFEIPALLIIGRYSYGMYVYHLPISGLAKVAWYNNLSPEARANPLVGFAFIVLLSLTTFFVSALSYELLERRILALKRFFPAGRLAKVQGAPAPATVRISR